MPDTADDHHDHHDNGGTAINDSTHVHIEPGRYHLQYVDLTGTFHFNRSVNIRFDRAVNIEHGPCTDDDCTSQHVHVTPADD